MLSLIVFVPLLAAAALAAVSRTAGPRVFVVTWIGVVTVGGGRLRGAAAPMPYPRPRWRCDAEAG